MLNVGKATKIVYKIFGHMVKVPVYLCIIKTTTT